MNYAEWMAEIDVQLQRMAGVSFSDLRNPGLTPDGRQDLFLHNVTPAEVVERAWINEMRALEAGLDYTRTHSMEGPGKEGAAERKRHREEWETTPEGVHAALDPAHLNSPALEALLVQTVMRLPDEVKEFVYAKVEFVDVGRHESGDSGILGQAFPRSALRRRWVVFLDSRIAVDFDEESAMGIIAHEIAHARLGHNMLRQKAGQRGAAWERAAAEQTAAWGFSGIAADPEHCAKGMI